MELQTVSCSGCGAPLSVPEHAEYVTCQYCQAQLHVKRTDSVVFTEVLKTLRDQSARLAENTEVIRLQNEIELLDQEWEQRSAELMVSGKHGRVSVPDKTSPWVGGAIIVGFGLVWTVLAGAVFPPMALFGVIFIAFGVWNCVRIYNQAHRYEELRHEHDRRRAELLSRLQAMKN